MANLLSLKLDIAQAKMFVKLERLTPYQAFDTILREYNFILADPTEPEAIEAQRLVGELQDELMKGVPC